MQYRHTQIDEHMTNVKNRLLTVKTIKVSDWDRQHSVLRSAISSNNLALGEGHLKSQSGGVVVFIIM